MNPTPSATAILLPPDPLDVDEGETLAAEAALELMLERAELWLAATELTEEDPLLVMVMDMVPEPEEEPMEVEETVSLAGQSDGEVGWWRG